MACSLRHEKRLWRTGLACIAGIDEAGRGPLAGPVIVAAVVLPQNFRLAGLDDSKRLDPIKRLRVFEALMRCDRVIWNVAERTHEDIDRVNILQATHEAMREAVLTLQLTVEHALVDGLAVPRFPCHHTALVGGDALSLSIAAASVIAKTFRDRAMENWHQHYPIYGFSHHKGYPTPAHLDTLRRYGPCPIHRKSYAPVAQAECWRISPHSARS